MIWKCFIAKKNISTLYYYIATTNLDSNKTIQQQLVDFKWNLLRNKSPNKIVLFKMFNLSTGQWTSIKYRIEFQTRKKSKKIVSKQFYFAFNGPCVLTINQMSHYSFIRQFCQMFSFFFDVFRNLRVKGNELINPRYAPLAGVHSQNKSLQRSYQNFAKKK